MLKKCQSNCPADKHLWIRNNIFYYMVEIPRDKDGKRRYFCKSLHTTNYYEAQEKMKTMVVDTTNKIIQAKADILAVKALEKQIKFDEIDEEVDIGGQILLRKVKRISDQNPPELVQQFFDCLMKLLSINHKVFQTLDEEDRKYFQSLFNEFKQEILAEIKMSGHKNTSLPTGNHTIEDIMKSMLQSLNATNEVIHRKERTIIKMVEWTGLKIRDKYSKFYKSENIRIICNKIKSMDVKGDVKRKYAMELRELIKHANSLEPDIYKTNLLNLIPKFAKTRKEETVPHWPYSDDELKQIFNPANDYFKEHPDVFWTTLIGMFVGARCNAAITLQYADIITESDIKCIKFQDTHPLKQLKNPATRRTVPIPSQLLNLGFVEYIERQKTKTNAKDTDLIFPNCETKYGTYNNKFATRGFIKYVNDIGITAKNQHKLDFHSLRKNASLRLEEAGVQESFANDIIGWEGKGTRQQHYSNHELQKIKEQADKLSYPFLQTEFDYWKDVMSKK